MGYDKHRQWRKIRLRICNYITIMDFMPIMSYECTTTYKKSVSHLGAKNVNFGKPRPPHIQAILKKYAYTSESVMGEKNPFYGKTHSIENKKSVGMKTRTRWQNTEFRDSMLSQWKEWHDGKGLIGRIFTQEHKNNLKESLKDVPRKYRNTKPEIQMQLALSLRGIKFEKHKIFKIGKRYHEVDLFIEPNIVVEVDGIYWHLPKKQMILDLEVNSELTVQGYYVIRIRDKDIMNNRDECVDNVMKLIDIAKQIPNLRKVM